MYTTILPQTPTFVVFICQVTHDYRYLSKIKLKRSYSERLIFYELWKHHECIIKRQRVRSQTNVQSSKLLTKRRITVVMLNRNSQPVFPMRYTLNIALISLMLVRRTTSVHCVSQILRESTLLPLVLQEAGIHQIASCSGINWSLPLFATSVNELRDICFGMRLYLKR